METVEQETMFKTLEEVVGADKAWSFMRAMEKTMTHKIKEAHEKRRNELATKGDLERVENNMRKEVQRVENKVDIVKDEVKQLEIHMYQLFDKQTKWIIGVGISIVVVILTAMALMK